MDYRITKLSDLYVMIDEDAIGGIVSVKYEIDHAYNSTTGPDMSNPKYDIVISYRPMIGIRRFDFRHLTNSTVTIHGPWRSVSFGMCKTRTLTCHTDTDGMIETVRLTGFAMAIE